MHFYQAILFTIFTTTGGTRGPHHPRGEAIVKHHVHYRPTRGSSEKLTQDAKLLHDKEHIEVIFAFASF